MERQIEGAVMMSLKVDGATKTPLCQHPDKSTAVTAYLIRKLENSSYEKPHDQDSFMKDRYSFFVAH